MNLYNANDMPLSTDEERRKVQEKILNHQELSIMDELKFGGRDRIIKEFGDFKFKPDHAYRAISEDLLEMYMKTGKISGFGPNDEYIEYEENGELYNNNKGVDWYLGGACLKYGNIIIECPADKKYFTPAIDNGTHLSQDPSVRHLKSSGYKNPVPTSMLTKAFKIDKNLNKLDFIFNKDSNTLTSKKNEVKETSLSVVYNEKSTLAWIKNKINNIKNFVFNNISFKTTKKEKSMQSSLNIIDNKQNKKDDFRKSISVTVNYPPSKIQKYASKTSQRAQQSQDNKENDKEL